jgi:hypothetical protein
MYVQSQSKTHSYVVHLFIVSLITLSYCWTFDPSTGRYHCNFPEHVQHGCYLAISAHNHCPYSNSLVPCICPQFLSNFSQHRRTSNCTSIRTIRNSNSIPKLLDPSTYHRFVARHPCIVAPPHQLNSHHQIQYSSHTVNSTPHPHHHHHLHPLQTHYSIPTS